MRILFAFAGGSGHLDPLLPVAAAAEAAGHTVAVTGRTALVPTIEALGFTAFPTGSGGRDAPGERLPLLPVSMEREDQALRDGFAGRIARERAGDVLGLCAAWQPDVIVCDEIDFGAMVAAERLGLPYATVLVIAAGSFVRRTLVAEPLNALRAEHGLALDPALAMLDRSLVLSPFPPSFRDPAFPLPPTAHGFRPLRPAAAAPRWPVHVPGTPTVYFTLGTVFNVESGDLFARVLAGLGLLPIAVVATVGPQLDPTAFAPVPDNVHVERHIPQSLVLPHCSAVVSHGGSGSVLGALAHGLPLVVLPMGADQPLNAARCEALGLGLALDAVAATPETVRAAVAAVLSEPSYRAAAERMRDELAALPEPAEVVTLLERLVP
jgi:UDP:flavonoid glycosyltransferase YjiC (YdhE family)